MKLRIVTDSASDLSPEIAKAAGVEVLPLLVYVDDVEYLDNVTITPNTLYQSMLNGKRVKTAQIPLNVFMDKFESYAKSEDHYIYLAFSSVLSGTYQTALLAYETLKETYPDFNMTIIDTKCVSLGLGILVLEAAEMVSKGESLETIINYVKTNALKMDHVFSVDDLEYLYRGGRVSRSQAMIGNMLNIKPILHVVDGALIPFAKVKGKKKLLSRLYTYIAERGEFLDQQTIGIAHTLNEDEALEVKEHFETSYGTKNFIISELGCAVGAHCGPGMITIFFKKKI